MHFRFFSTSTTVIVLEQFPAIYFSASFSYRISIPTQFSFCPSSSTSTQSLDDTPMNRRSSYPFRSLAVSINVSFISSVIWSIMLMLQVYFGQLKFVNGLSSLARKLNRTSADASIPPIIDTPRPPRTPNTSSVGKFVRRTETKLWLFTPSLIVLTTLDKRVASHSVNVFRASPKNSKSTRSKSPVKASCNPYVLAILSASCQHASSASNSSSQCPDGSLNRIGLLST